MKISEMNKCIAEMRDCYRFKDDETDIMLVDLKSGKGNCVTVCTKDKMVLKSQ